VVTHQLQVERRTAKARRPKTDVLPLDHAVGDNYMFCSVLGYSYTVSVGGNDRVLARNHPIGLCSFITLAHYTHV